jgi:hypothetical protein
MTGKVFSYGDHAFIFKSLDKRVGQPGHGFRVGSDSAVADDGVLRIGMNVEHGSIIHIDSHICKFGRQRLAEPVGQGFRLRMTQTTQRRVLGEGLCQPGYSAAFLVDRNKQGQSCGGGGRHTLEIPD